MLYDDDPRRGKHWPIWSEDRMLGRFCGNATVCAPCHPQACSEGGCVGFTVNDVVEGHVGRSCDRCGASLPGSEGAPVVTRWFPAYGCQITNHVPGDRHWEIGQCDDEWTGEGWRRICPSCDLVMAGQTPDGSRACVRCGLLAHEAPERQVAP